MPHKKILITIFIISFLTTAFSLAGAANNVQRAPRLNIRGNTEDDITGRVSLLYPFKNREDSLYYLDLRSRVSTDNISEWNLGLGYRRKLKQENHIAGIYLFRDRREQLGRYWDQWTVGGEILTDSLDTRLNIYLPQDQKAAVPQLDSVVVKDRKLIYRRGSYRSMSGFDFEIGSRFTEKEGLLKDVGGYLKYYRFFDDYTETMEGTEIRINKQFGDRDGINYKLGLTWRDDNLHEASTEASFAISIPLGQAGSRNSKAGKDKEDCQERLEARMTESPKRDLDIIVGESSGDDAPVETARDPVTSNSLDSVVYVARDGYGEGSKDNPTNLADREEINKADVIILQGKTGKMPLAETIELKPGQKLLTPGGHLIVTDRNGNRADIFKPQGSRATLETTDNYAGSSLIELNDNTAVSGLKLVNDHQDNKVSYGFHGSELSGNININNNEIDFRGNTVEGDKDFYGMYLGNEKGTRISLRDNKINNFQKENNFSRGIMVKNIDTARLPQIKGNVIDDSDIGLSFDNISGKLTDFNLNYGDYNTIAAAEIDRVSDHILRNWRDLNAVSYNLDGDYLLKNNLGQETAGYADLAGSNAHTGKGWQPLGDAGEGFTGNFRGNNRQIAGLYIERNSDNQGLFAKLGEGSQVRDLTITNSNMKTASKAGVLAGEAVGAKIVNCTVNNAVIDIYQGMDLGNEFEFKGQERIGGMIGESKNSRIDNCSVSNLTMMANSIFEEITFSARLGGLAGLVNGGAVLNSSSSNVTITGKDKSASYNHNIGYVGGLIGEMANESTEKAVVDNCEAVDISLNVGISALYSNMAFAVSKSGGLIGAVGEMDTGFEVNGDFVIKNSSAAGTIAKGSAGKWNHLIGVGGFVGTAEGTATPSGELLIRNCEADVNLDIPLGDLKYFQPLLEIAVEHGGLGGFSGFLKAADIEKCSAKGNIVVETLDNAPAFVGGFAAKIQNSKVTKSYATGDIDGRWSGGFAGSVKNSDISRCYAGGDVVNLRDYEGGFVGRLISGTISNSYAQGDVTGNDFYTGGFVGAQEAGEIKNCYSIGNVLGDKPKYPITAGLVGSGASSGIVQDSIAFNQQVKQKNPISRLVNRISGRNEGTLNNNYAYEDMVVTYDGTEKTGTSDLNSDWGKDMTQEQFASEDFFTNPDNWIKPWDFDDVWEIKPGADRPTLQGVGEDNGVLP